MSGITTFAVTSSQYLQSLMDYVLDIKPYHTKLAATGAVSEGYQFTDAINVTITDSQSSRMLMGADLLPAVAVPGGGRARISQSWWHDIVSNGSTSTWLMPQIDEPFFASEENLSSFVCGTNDYTGIVGLARGAFDPKRFDGPGITVVTRNGVQQQDTVHYTLSNGIYSFDVGPGGNWVEHDLSGVGAFGFQSGTLAYQDVIRAGGSIQNITGGNYEEWTITTTYVDSSTTDNPQFPAQASVVGSSSGNIGTATWGQTFTAPEISFFWGPAPQETTQTTQLGDVWVLTPSPSLVTTAPGAPQETWSIIWSNPIALNGAPVFTPGASRTDTPALEIHTRSLDQTNEEVSWSIIFNGDGTYSLHRTALSNPNGIAYPITISLIDGCSFKNADIAYTILPTVTGWNAGDTFSWTVGPSVANFKVYGSVSGWQADAKIGTWYWNGKVGFKIPALDYFLPDETVDFTALKPVSSMALPSVYVVTFVTSTNATVYNNVYGYRDGLVLGEPWSDEFTSFQIDTLPPGNVARVYLTNSATYTSISGYERYPYEEHAYDEGNVNLTVGDDYCAQLYPFYHSNGAVIWHASSGTGTTLNVGDQISIDKGYLTPLRLSITGSSANYPELAAVNDWVPLSLKFFDNVGSTPTNGLYPPTSTADWSDLGTYIQAYSAANPDQLIFSVLSPRYKKTDRVGSSQLTFDPTFFSTYLPFGTGYSIRYEPDGVYGQKIIVRVVENLKINARIYLALAEGPNAVGVPPVTVDVQSQISFYFPLASPGENFGTGFAVANEFGVPSQVGSASPTSVNGVNIISIGGINGYGAEIIQVLLDGSLPQNFFDSIDVLLTGGNPFNLTSASATYQIVTDGTNTGTAWTWDVTDILDYFNDGVQTTVTFNFSGSGPGLFGNGYFLYEYNIPPLGTPVQGTNVFQQLPGDAYGPLPNLANPSTYTVVDSQVTAIDENDTDATPTAIDDGLQILETTIYSQDGYDVNAYDLNPYDAIPDTIGFAIIGIVAGAAGFGSFTVKGNYVPTFTAGSTFQVMDFSAADGTYTVSSSALSSGNTVINVVETVPLATVTSFTASISGALMTVSSMTSGTITVGDVVFGTGVPANTYVISFGSGAGGTGTYNLSTTTGSVASETMYAGGYLVPTDPSWTSGGSRLSATFDFNIVEPVGYTPALSITNGSGYVDGTYNNVPLTGGHGTGATADIKVSGGAVSIVTPTNPGTNYQAGDILSAIPANLGGSGSGFSISVVSSSNTFGIGNGYGLLITTHADVYLITMINGSGTGYPPNLTVGNVLDANGKTTVGSNYANPTGNPVPVFPSNPGVTSTKSFTFSLPPGFALPFRLWIT